MGVPDNGEAVEKKVNKKKKDDSYLRCFSLFVALELVCFPNYLN
jgi:hypothetical protein